MPKGIANNMKVVQSPDSAGRRVKSWWAAVLAGQVDEPHPNHGADLDVAFKGGVLHLSGELASETDRQTLLEEARDFVGHGVDKVDAKHLTVANAREEKHGVLDQTLIAAFANRDVAEFARKYLVESRRVKPKQLEILDPPQEGRAAQLLPPDFVSDVQKAFKAGQAVLILRVDETEAFRVRELLAQETRSIWTIATPPAPATPTPPAPRGQAR
ncbi:MAG: hypothetical protein M3003_03845 [Candidatus Dormibacteraeota bacterium]|nr:hypothetical protein [Candidatus Dormibacteraeota bacterium]